VTVEGVAPAVWEYLRVAPLLRGRLGRRMIVHWRPVPEAMSFAADPRVRALAERGPVTPDHVIRTKQRPLVLRAGPPGRGGDHGGAGGVSRALRRLFSRAVGGARGDAGDAGRGPAGGADAGPGDRRAGGGRGGGEDRRGHLYEHTIAVIRDAEQVGRYQALPDGDIFDMEYWSLEQAKLGKATPRALAGQVVYVTGAASGIGLACARRFAAAGARCISSTASRAVKDVAAAEGGVRGPRRHRPPRGRGEPRD
jgi:hypothetical protein